MDGKIEFKSQNWKNNKFEMFLREATKRLSGLSLPLPDQNTMKINTIW